MKYWFPLLLGVAATAAGATGRVEVVLSGVALPAEAGVALEPLIVRLLESCDVDSTTYVDQPGAWEEIPRRGSYVRVRWPQPLEVRTDGGGLVLVHEALVALGAGITPDHLHVKSGHRLRSLTKYAPEVLLAIAQEPRLGLADSQPFVQWARIDWLAAKAQALRSARPGR